MEVPEVHAPHTRHSGNRWLDMMLGGSAFIISLVSLWLGIQHGRTMERLVAANSWPNIEFDTVVDRRAGTDAAELLILLNNNGIGPARIETLELWVGKTPVTDVAALTRAVAAHRDADAPAAAHNPFGIESASVSGYVIGARQKQTLVALTAADGSHWAAAMLRTIGTLHARICYCSVFDECYVNDTRRAQPKPRRVEACPVPGQPFRDDASALVLAKIASNLPDTPAAKPR